MVRPVIKEDLRHDLKQLEVRQVEAGHELVLPDGARISGSSLAIYGVNALDPDNLCQGLVEELISRAFHGETGAVLAMGQTGSGKSHLMGTECCRWAAGRAVHALVQPCSALVLPGLLSAGAVLKASVQAATQKHILQGARGNGTKQGFCGLPLPTLPPPLLVPTGARLGQAVRTGPGPTLWASLCHAASSSWLGSSSWSPLTWSVRWWRCACFYERKVSTVFTWKGPNCTRE